MLMEPKNQQKKEISLKTEVEWHEKVLIQLKKGNFNTK